MKSLDEAVQKFKILKQKLKNISEQPAIQTKVYIKSPPNIGQNVNGNVLINTNQNTNLTNAGKNSMNNRAQIAHINKANTTNLVPSNISKTKNGLNIYNSKQMGFSVDHHPIPDKGVNRYNQNCDQKANSMISFNKFIDVVPQALTLQQDKKKIHIISNNKQNNQNIQNRLNTNNKNTTKSSANTKNMGVILSNTHKSVQKQSMRQQLKSKPQKLNQSLVQPSTFCKPNSKMSLKCQETISPKNQTKKKTTHHKKNNSWNYQTSLQPSYNPIHTLHPLYPSQLQQISIGDRSPCLHVCEHKSTSLNNSRISDYTIELKQKEKTLFEINSLLEQKKEVLEALERKIGDGVFAPNWNYEPPTNKISKKVLRAPNLFQMQVQARKRSKSKQLTIHWK